MTGTGKRYSKQRELIYQCLMGTDEHPTAEMVYQWLKPGNPSLSLGTVYRNLNLLAEEGVITRMPFPIERYDAVTRPHPHFRCRKCGAVYDLGGVSYDAELDEKAGTLSGHQVDHHDLIFTGTCTHCIARH